MPGRFRLLRYFSWSCLVGMVVVMACLTWGHRALMESHFLAQVGQANADLARAFGASVWSRYRAFFREANGRPVAELLASPTLRSLEEDVADRLYALNVAKVKIYTTQGLTVFSTDLQQIGTGVADNPHFRRALSAIPSNDLLFKGTFNAHEGGVRLNRDVVESYVPIRASTDGPVEAVMEIYTDVTEAVASQRRSSLQLSGIVLAALALLWGFLYFVVRKADRILAQQERQRARAEAEIRRKAYHDALTGLPNRESFAACLEETFALRELRPAALMFVDLDRFKAVNDTFGHGVGDELLVAAAARIAAGLRADDRAFRLGGDEFTLILPDIADRGGAAAIATRLIELLSTPFRVGRHELGIGASIGIALCPGDGDSVDELLRHADAALYEAKNKGRNTFALCSEALRERMRCEGRLRAEAG